MATKKQAVSVSPDEYLLGEKESLIKHEYVEGGVYAMAGASENHNRISVNLLSEMRTHLKNSPCEPFMADMKVKTVSNFFYPDVMVSCEDDNEDPYYKEKPVIIVEVLSKTTRRIDETTKRFAYMNIPSLQEYVLVDQDIVDVEVCRKSEGWISRHYYLGDVVPLTSIGLDIAVEEIYHRVDNEEMTNFRKNSN